MARKERKFFVMHTFTIRFRTPFHQSIGVLEELLCWINKPDNLVHFVVLLFFLESSITISTKRAYIDEWGLNSIEYVESRHSDAFVVLFSRFIFKDFFRFAFFLKKNLE